MSVTIRPSLSLSQQHNSLPRQMLRQNIKPAPPFVLLPMFMTIKKRERLHFSPSFFFLVASSLSGLHYTCTCMPVAHTHSVVLSLCARHTQKEKREREEPKSFPRNFSRRLPLSNWRSLSTALLLLLLPPPPQAMCVSIAL